jgi:hypothetical protein
MADGVPSARRCHESETSLADFAGLGGPDRFWRGFWATTLSGKQTPPPSGPTLTGECDKMDHSKMTVCSDLQ